MQQLKDNEPTVTVIVPVHNESKNLPAFFKAIAAQTYSRNSVEILVVDNNSTDDSQEVAKRFGARVVTETSASLSDVARNRGIQEAQGSIILFTDGDCRPDPRWIEEMVLMLKEDPQQIVAGKVRVEFGFQPSGAEIYDSMAFLNHADSVQNRKIAFTANLGLYSKAARDVGGFPTSLIIGDSYFSRRCHQMGYELRYHPDAIVSHPARQLRPLLRKARRVGFGRMLGGNFDNYSPSASRGGYRSGLMALLKLPHVRAINPILIWKHLQLHHVNPSFSKVLRTMTAGLAVLTFAAIGAVEGLALRFRCRFNPTYRPRQF